MKDTDVPLEAEIILWKKHALSYRVPFFDQMVTVTLQDNGHNLKEYEDGTKVWLTSWGDTNTCFPDGGTHIEQFNGMLLFLPRKQKSS